MYGTSERLVPGHDLSSCYPFFIQLGHQNILDSAWKSNTSTTVWYNSLAERAHPTTKNVAREPRHQTEACINHSPPHTSSWSEASVCIQFPRGRRHGQDSREIVQHSRQGSTDESITCSGQPSQAAVFSIKCSLHTRTLFKTFMKMKNETLITDNVFLSRPCTPSYLQTECIAP